MEEEVSDEPAKDRVLAGARFAGIALALTITSFAAMADNRTVLAVILLGFAGTSVGIAAAAWRWAAGYRAARQAAAATYAHLRNPEPPGHPVCDGADR